MRPFSQLVVLTNRCHLPRKAAEVSSILLDRQRNLWVSTFHHGLYRVSRDLVVTFATDSVLREPLLRLAECPGGALAGITAIIQPGGSIRDEMAIEAADRHHLAMVFTGRRHFRH